MIYAGVALRSVAVLIDGVLFFVITLIIALFTGGAYSTTETAGGQLVSYTEEAFMADLSRAKQGHASGSD